MGRTWEARVAEYQNSPKLAYRTRAGPWASAWVFGTMELYRTRVHLKDEWEIALIISRERGAAGN